MTNISPVKRDKRPGILLAHSMPRHPKIEALSDKAFRVLIWAWCYCSEQRTDGRIPDQAWARLGPARARTELLTPPITGGSPLAYQRSGYVEMHDYLEHQRSAAEIEALTSARGESGELGAHKRWHVARRVVVQECAYCQQETAGA